MGLLLTTSRGCRAARELCRSLASLIPGAVCENRGSKTVEDVVERARLLGKARAAFIHEKGGKPSELHFARVGAASWGWLEPAFAILSAEAKSAEGQPEGARLAGPLADDWRNLLGLPMHGADGEVSIACAKKSVKFTLNKKAMAELVFE